MQCHIKFHDFHLHRLLAIKQTWHVAKHLQVTYNKVMLHCVSFANWSIKKAVKEICKSQLNYIDVRHDGSGTYSHGGVDANVTHGQYNMSFSDFCSSTSLHGWQYLGGLDNQHRYNKHNINKQKNETSRLFSMEQIKSAHFLFS